MRFTILNILGVLAFAALLLIISAGPFVPRDATANKKVISGVQMANKPACTKFQKEKIVILPTEIKLEKRDLMLFDRFFRELDDKTMVTIINQGYGGRADQAGRIISAIQDSKACVKIKTVGNVYSAHAYIALSGDILEIDPDVTLMYHRGSFYNMTDEVCADERGKVDRGLSGYDKCIQFLEEYNKHELRFMKRTIAPFLTEDEFNKVLNGEDIYVFGDVMMKRLLNAKN